MILLISCSLLLIACEEEALRPDAYLCSIVIEEDSMHCKNLRYRDVKVIKIKDANKYVCASDRDFSTIVDYLKDKKSLLEACESQLNRH
jgi:hypothetical protein